MGLCPATGCFLQNCQFLLSPVLSEQSLETLCSWSDVCHLDTVSSEKRVATYFKNMYAADLTPVEHSYVNWQPVNTAETV